jgi:hypothetical protein
MDRESRPSRRRVLTALGGASVALAGCLVSDEDDTEPASNEPNDTDPKDQETDDPEDPTKTPDGPHPTDTRETDTPTEPDEKKTASTDSTDRVEPIDAPGQCPDYDTEHVVCYDAAADDLEKFPGYLEPSRKAFGPGEPVTFTLHNDSERTLNTNFYNWRLHKRVDGEWYSVAPRFVNQPLMMLEPGDTQAWELTVDNEGIEDGQPVRPVSGVEDIDLTGVGPGRYAFRASGWFEGQDHETDTAFAATLDFEGESLSLTPSNAIDRTEWEDETLVAESNRGRPDDEDYRLGAYELERVESGDGAPTMITEQVLRRAQLRDVVALALEHDADSVRLEEYNATHPIFGIDSTRAVAYQGETFEISSRVLSQRE